MFSLGRIVLPVDFSERSAGAARYVHALATRFASEVTLLHVLPPPHYEFSALEVGGTVLNELFASRVAQVGRELDEYLMEELADISVKRLLLEGDPARKIVEYVSSIHADLIVMPTHGYGSFRRFILGSVTAKVLHDADLPGVDQCASRRGGHRGGLGKAQRRLRGRPRAAERENTALGGGNGKGVWRGACVVARDSRPSSGAGKNSRESAENSFARKWRHSFARCWMRPACRRPLR